MRYIILFFGCITMCWPLSAHGLKVRLTGATSCSWSGGVAGKHGVNYHFTIVCSDIGSNEPKPDTLWIGKKCVPLSLVPVMGSSNNLVKRKSGNTLTFEISGGTSNADEPQVTGPGQALAAAAIEPPPPIAYTGVALLSYHYNGRRQYFVIKKILTVYPPVNYP